MADFPNITMPTANAAALSQALAAHLAAKARHAEARRLFNRATRAFEAIDMDRAYVAAGPGLADERFLRAYSDMAVARAALKASLSGATITARLTVIGAVLCADLPQPANEA